MITNIALVGKMCAGKTTVARRLKEILYEAYGVDAVLVDMSYRIKSMAAREAGVTVEELEKNKQKYRQRLQSLSTAYRGMFGEDAFCEDAVEMATGRFNIIDNVRNLAQAKYFDDHGWLLAGIDCDESIRLDRIRQLYGREPTEAEMNNETEAGVQKVFEAGIPVFTNNSEEDAELIALWLYNQTVDAVEATPANAIE